MLYEVITFLIELTKNKGLPIGGALWVPALHPELKLAPPYTSWTFPGAITRMPEFAAPTLGNKDNLVSLDRITSYNVCYTKLLRAITGW